MVSNSLFYFVFTGAINPSCPNSANKQKSQRSIQRNYTVPIILRSQFFQHLNQKFLLLNKLMLIIYTSLLSSSSTLSRKEIQQESNQFFRVLLQNCLHLRCLVWISDKHFKNVERLVLDERLRLSKHIHNIY